MSVRVAVVLPRKETFSRERFGAITLTVEDYVRYSAHRSEIEVLGVTAATPRLPEAFRAVAPLDRWWRRKNIGFAAGCAAHMRPSPPRYIDIHNRVEVFHYFAKQFPEARLSLWLHNDPQSMRAATSAGARQRILNSAHNVVCVSEWVRQRFLEGITTHSERAVVLPNAMAPAAAPPTAKQPLILFVGRLIADKGADLLAEALALALPSLPGWQAALVGTGTARMTARLRDALGPMRDRVAMPGFVPHEQVLEMFSHAAIAVVPSVWQEPFGRTALEAMVAGCAVITSGTGGLGEVVGDTGVIVASPTPSGLAADIQALAMDDLRRRDLQGRARARAAENFAIARWAARWDALHP